MDGCRHHRRLTMAAPTFMVVMASQAIQPGCSSRIPVVLSCATVREKAMGQAWQEAVCGEFPAQKASVTKVWLVVFRLPLSFWCLEINRLCVFKGRSACKFLGRDECMKGEVGHPVDWESTTRLTTALLGDSLSLTIPWLCTKRPLPKTCLQTTPTSSMQEAPARVPKSVGAEQQLMIVAMILVRASSCALLSRHTLGGPGHILHRLLPTTAKLTRLVLLSQQPSPRAESRYSAIGVLDYAVVDILNMMSLPRTSPKAVLPQGQLQQEVL